MIIYNNIDYKIMHTMGNVISKSEKQLPSNTLIHLVDISNCSNGQHNSNGCIGNPLMATICTRSDGNHLLIKDFPENKIPYLIKKTSVEGKSKLTKNKNTVNREINNLISSSSSTSVDMPLEIPPFESPAIVEILLNFCLYKYRENFSDLTIAIKIAVAIIQLYESWEWITPEKLPHVKPFPHCNSYLYYYKRYQQYFRMASSKPIYKVTMVFGQDVLRYTLNEFKIYLINLFNTEQNNWTNSKRNFYLKLFPSFINGLEREVYASDSPIWILNLRNMYNDNMNTSSTELNKETSPESHNIINNNNKSKNQKKLMIVLKHMDIPDFITKDMNNLIKVLNLVKLDSITYSKGFIISHQKLQIQRRQRLHDEQPVIKWYSSRINCTEDILWHNALKTIYRTQAPRIPDRYIVRLESDKEIETLAVIVNDLPVAAIYFRQYKPEGFTEIVLCTFKSDLHDRELETEIMNCFKHHNVKSKIYILITCTEYKSIGYFLGQQFHYGVNMLKSKYDKYIQQYPSTKLMHCILKKPNK